jgi:hypothetical protein
MFWPKARTGTLLGEAVQGIGVCVPSVCIKTNRYRFFICIIIRLVAGPCARGSMDQDYNNVILILRLAHTCTLKRTRRAFFSVCFPAGPRAGTRGSGPGVSHMSTLTIVPTILL